MGCGRWTAVAVGGAWLLSLALLHASFSGQISGLQRALADARSAPDASRRVGLDWERSVVVYNRIPKTGSTTFANGVLYDLARPNGFHCLHLNVSRNAHTMTLADQARFVENTTQWSQRLPAVYHGHVAFIDFGLFGAPRPVYINIVREPLERFLTYYYFLRYGDNYRPHLHRKREGDTETFDQCVARHGRDCQPESMWLQIPFFCGHHPGCWEAGSAWALERAKRVLVEEYLLVGTTERLTDFVLVLQETFPRLFAGAHERLLRGTKSHLRKTNKKVPPSEETMAKLKAHPVYRMESEFYRFAQEQFEFQWERLHNDAGEVRQKEFHYEKIKPKLEF